MNSLKTEAKGIDYTLVAMQDTVVNASGAFATTFSFGA